MDDISECACFNVRRAGRALSRAYDRALESSGLTNVQFSVLGQLYHAPEGVTVGELAQRLGMDRTTLTRNAALLKDRALVTITPGKADRREKQLMLTKTGNKALSSAYPHWKAMQQSVKRRLGPTPWKNLTEGLAALEALEVQ